MIAPEALAAAPTPVSGCEIQDYTPNSAGVGKPFAEPEPLCLTVANGSHLRCNMAIISLGNARFICEDYTEKLTFTLVKGGVRNRAGTNEQFCGAVKYDQSIQDLRGNGLHEVNGMYPYLNEIYNHPADDDSIETDFGGPELSSGVGVNGPSEPLRPTELTNSKRGGSNV
jgi:hypothetical protein